MSTLFRALTVLLIALAVTGCGKKGAPQPPPDVPNTYPRTYPSE
jgi:predicted small lipoprotein YifL